MNDTGLRAAFQATWPAAEYADAGGFRVGCGLGGGGRVSCAMATGPWTEADLHEAVGLHQRWGQRPMFLVFDDDALLIAALKARAFVRESPTVVMEIPVAALTDSPVPMLSAFTIWPPLAIQREIWSAGGIGPARQAVMERVSDPHISIMGRVEDRVAGTAFAAVHGPVAMVHAIETDPILRRRGVAGRMMRQAAFWAADRGAERLALAVTRANVNALALYERMGFQEVAGYTYYARPEGWA